MSEFKVLNDGFRIPTIGLGTWQVKDEIELESLLDAALEAGYRHFDGAYFNENEKVLGRVFQKWFRNGQVKREDLFIVSKLPMIGMWPYRVNEFLKLTLQNLNLDYVDLYMIQFPVGFSYVDTDQMVPLGDSGNVSLDNKIHLDAIWKAMEHEISRGRTKSIGVCNFNETQLSRVLNSSKIPPAILQVEANLYFQQKSLRTICEKNKICLSAFGPLGKQVICEQSNGDFNFTSEPLIKLLAQKYKKTEAQIVIRFLLHSGFIVIPRSANVDRLRENINVFDFSLEPNELEKLQQLDKGETGHSKRAYFRTLFPGAEEHPEYPWK